MARHVGARLHITLHRKISLALAGGGLGVWTSVVQGTLKSVGAESLEVELSGAVEDKAERVTTFDNPKLTMLPLRVVDSVQVLAPAAPPASPQAVSRGDTVQVLAGAFNTLSNGDRNHAVDFHVGHMGVVTDNADSAGDVAVRFSDNSSTYINQDFLKVIVKAGAQ